MLSALNFDKNTPFIHTDLYRFLQTDPLRIIDIGARDGIHEMFLPLGKLAKVLAFEPDREGYEALCADRGLKNQMADFIVRQEASGNGTKATFYLMAKPTNHSLLRSNDTLVKRYKMELFHNVSSVPITTRRLDDIAYGPKAPCPGFGEIVKIDTQGSEHLILSHAQSMLRETTIALLTEVWFCQIYENQPLFHDVCALLAPFGLRFYGFTSFFLRSGKRLDKKRYLGRERALYADAIFLKDPLDAINSTISMRHYAVLFMFACMTGYFDLALELVEIYAEGAEAASLRASIDGWAAIDPALLQRQAEQAIAIAAGNPEGAAIAIGKFVDTWRSYFDYGDMSSLPEAKQPTALAAWTPPKT